MEKFTSFDRSTDTITTIDQFGVTSSSDIESFIRSGKMATLSWQCKARLYPYLKGRKDIVADRGVGGGHNFSLVGDQPLLVYLWGLYMATLILCPLLFGSHFGWWSVDFTLASLLFPLSFCFLNPVSELYGRRNARRLLNSTVWVLMTLAMLGWGIQTLALWLPVFDHTGFSHETLVFEEAIGHYPQAGMLNWP